MAAIRDNINTGSGIEHFYGYVFGNRKADAMKTDRDILEKLSKFNIFAALGTLHYKGLISTEIVLIISSAACGLGLVGRNQKPPELPSVGQPTIGLVTQETAGNDAILNQQLTGVKNLSGRADCQPQLVLVDGGILGAETIGLCQVETELGLGIQMIVRGQKNGDQETINQMLVARSHLGTDGKSDTLYFEYKNGGQTETLFKYDVASGNTEWILLDGKVIEFKNGQNPFEVMIGKILDPGNVAQAAEATQVYDPTKPATVTATLDGRLTITQPAPTPEPTATVEPTPQLRSDQIYVEGIGIVDVLIDGQTGKNIPLGYFRDYVYPDGDGNTASTQISGVIISEPYNQGDASYFDLAIPFQGKLIRYAVMFGEKVDGVESRTGYGLAPAESGILWTTGYRGERSYRQNIAPYLVTGRQVVVGTLISGHKVMIADARCDIACKDRERKSFDNLDQTMQLVGVLKGDLGMDQLPGEKEYIFIARELDLRANK